MAKKKVKVGDEVKNKCPVCGMREVEFPENQSTFTKLKTRITIWCSGCRTDFWLDSHKITVKKIDKNYVV